MHNNPERGDMRRGAMRAFEKMVAVLSLAVSFSSFAQAATVTGTVKGPDGTPFEGAFVQAISAKTKIMVSVLSDKQGRYRVENLPAGEYQVRVRAIGFTADPHGAVSLTADQNVSFEFALQKGTVRWSDLSLYQGKKLLPEGKGKDTLFADCFICHGFQTRMAAVRRDAEGWRDRVDYMRESMAFQLSEKFTDENANEVASYLNSVFGEDSTLPRSPADLPGYKATVRPFADEAMNMVYVEYDVSGSKGLPWSAAPDKDGNFWMPFYGRGNEVARLNPKTGEVKRFPLPFDQTAGVHSALPAPDGMVYFTEFALNKLAKLDPRTGKITEFPDDLVMSDRRANKHTVRMDAKGNLWSSGSPLSKYDPETGKYTYFMEVPWSYGITFDKDGNVWFCVLEKNGKIGKVDAKTEKVTQWSPPTQGMPQRLEIDSDGMVWFSERSGHKIGRFDPKTETFKEYPLPGPSASPYALTVDKRGVWYASTDQDLIGRLDPNTGMVIEYPFPHSEAMIREFFIDAQGRIWFATPTNNRVGYFYFAGANERASK
jgi:virginiamycin B lyase